MDQKQQLIAILSDRIARAKITLDEKRTAHKTILVLVGLLSAAALILVVGLHGIAPADKTISTADVETLNKTIAEQQIIIDVLVRIGLSMTLQKTNSATISSCSHDLI